MNPLEFLYAWEDVLRVANTEKEAWKIRKAIRKNGIPFGHYPIRCQHIGRGSVRWR